MKVYDVTKSGLKLKWEKPEDDGGLPITSYQIEKLDKATGRWVPVGRTSDTEMDVKGLQEGHEYEFRVKAINEEGESEPLVTDSSTIAKNPYGERREKLRVFFAYKKNIRKFSLINLNNNNL